MKTKDNELTIGEKKILAMAINNGKINPEDGLKCFRSVQYSKQAMKRLSILGLLVLTEFGGYIITEAGKEALGIEVDRKLTEFEQIKN